MGRYIHPSMPGATRKDLKYWRNRRVRLDSPAASFKDFFINAVFNLRRRVKVAWQEFLAD